MAEETRPHRTDKALVWFAVLEAAAIPLLLLCGRGWWFWADEWDFLAGRTGGRLDDLFRPHYGHWSTLPILVYRLLWTVFGLRTYVPYQLLVIVAHLTAAALLRVVMRRAGVRPWLATVAAGAFVFFGAGAEMILIAFNITFAFSLVLGLAQLLLADHDGPIDRRDVLGLAAGLAGLMCSGVSVTMAIVVGLAVLSRRGWRIALFHTVPLGAAYLAWSVLAPKGTSAGAHRSQSPWQLAQFVVRGVESTFGRWGQLPGVGLVLFFVVLVGLAVTVRERGRQVRWGRLAVPVALLAGAGIFLVMTGVARSGQPGTLVGAVRGAAAPLPSRYLYLTVAMTLPALALAVDAVIRRWHSLAIPAVVVLLAGVPGNVHQLRTYTKQGARVRNEIRADILATPRLPIAKQLPRTLSPAPFAGLTLGWLVDSLPSGRIPKPPRMSPTDLATLTLNLAVRPARIPAKRNCQTLTRPVVRVLQKKGKLTLKSGTATLDYRGPDGSTSVTEIFSTRGVVAQAGPLELLVTPVTTRIVLCQGGPVTAQ